MFQTFARDASAIVSRFWMGLTCCLHSRVYTDSEALVPAPLDIESCTGRGQHKMLVAHELAKTGEFDGFFGGRQSRAVTGSLNRTVRLRYPRWRHYHCCPMLTPGPLISVGSPYNGRDQKAECLDRVSTRRRLNSVLVVGRWAVQ